ncbi:FAD-dependent oxidoreductase [Curvibacter sp. HBC61]|uniref:FAD-dependent oxidoreductase n=1 Tax=Curvibacter cyanobacteriorum TaxID=3026422 RepID=A0ABT5MXI2_9BURK|nr:FAD-dependent oxidoreductase [Curvibacter sp. HBC61]MDD0838044.1 FAD-dependent oxidoreductase [Curvibacter sp. HBC61]
MSIHDYVIVGAGIAGASVAWQLAEHGRVLLLERESQPGYHSTGRSAAMFMETYGTPNIQALTRASRAFYESPPEVFGPHPILSPRGVVYIASEAQRPLLDQALSQARAQSPNVRELSQAELLAAVPCLRPEAAVAGMAEPLAADLDVNTLHQGYLRGARQRGVELRCDAEVQALQRVDGVWQVELANGQRVQGRQLINAAGAWADVLAGLAGVAPIGLQPCRRSAFTFAAPAGLDSSRWPAVVGIDESFYFKPDAGQLLGSPANADPTEPHDVVPEELDIATGIYHIEEATTLQIRRPAHTWAGLRSFVPDGDLVIGWDPAQEGFFWLAAQGGYGIQSAAGASLLARQLILGEPVDALVAAGVDVDGLSPRRLRA